MQAAKKPQIRYVHNDRATKAFAQWLRRERKDLGWSIHKLAVESGVSKSALWNIEKQLSSPSLSTVGEICDALGVDPILALSEGLVMV